jgi:lipopolysaccharide/colanic/teichoic acid biosynthesis glycosyltransferase
MNAILNNQTISFDGDPELKTIFKNQRRKLLLIHSAAIEKENFLTDIQAIVVNNIAEAKEKILLNKKSFFDAIICDSEFGRKNVLELISFLNSKKLNNYIPFLLLDFQNKIDDTWPSNNLEGIDDLITTDISVTDLNNKISILKKYKFYQNKLPYNTEPLKAESFNHTRINYQYILKRFLDVTLASVLLVLFSPLILSIAIAIKLESKGPVFYKSLRAGRWYNVFTFFKFRTMVINADSMIADLQYVNEYKDQQTSFFFKLRDDPRVTRVGKFLRKASLDELPQLINVLKGDMSMVGNRPLPLYEAKTITVDKSAKRFFATAGITGFWQVTGRSNLNLSAKERIAMDINYADRSSFLFDMKILLKTPKELIYKGNV